MAIEVTIPDEWDESECPPNCKVYVSDDQFPYCALNLHVDDDENFKLRPSRRCPGPGTYKLIRVNKKKEQP